MPRPIWNGVITFGLVTIPVQLLPATRDPKGFAVHYLHAKDRGRIKNSRVCSVDGKEVPWSEVVRGYELEKGRVTVLSDEELHALAPESNQSVEISEFVALSEIDPILFDKPYYLRPEKKGQRAYAILRQALLESERVGIAKVVIRTRQYLAAVKPSGRALVLHLLRFEDELVKTGDLDLPGGKESVHEPERKAARMLVDAMTRRFDLHAFADTYQDELRKLLKKKGAGGAVRPSKAAPEEAKGSNVVDLVGLLEQSLSSKKRAGGKEPRRRKAS